MKIKKMMTYLLLPAIMACGACSSDDHEENIIQADYMADFGFSESNYEVFNRPNNAIYCVKDGKYIYEIGSDGSISQPFTIPDIHGEAKFRALVAADNSHLYYLAGTYSVQSGVIYERKDVDKVYTFNASGQPQHVFTFQPAGSPLAPKVNISAIGFDGEHSFYVFDKGTHQMKRWMPEMNAELIVAGSEQNAMQDGTGLSASLSNVSKILSHKGYIYFIDDDGQYNAIRRMSKATYEVQTLFKRKSSGSYVEGVDNFLRIYDFAIDSKDNIYISAMDYLEIFTLISTDTISPFFRSLEIRTKDGRYGLGGFDKETLWIDSNDALYFTHGYRVFKMSDFETTIEEFNRKKGS